MTLLFPREVRKDVSTGTGTETLLTTMELLGKQLTRVSICELPDGDVAHTVPKYEASVGSIATQDVSLMLGRDNG